MQLYCPCLNVSVTVRPVLSLPEVKPLDSLHSSLLGGSLNSLLEELSEEERSDHFFHQPSAPHLVKFHPEECQVVQQVSFLIAQRQVDRWTVSQCLICSRVTHATGTIGGSPAVLIRASNLLRDAKMIEQLRSSPQYSKAFQIVLPDTTAVPTSDNSSYHGKKISQAIQSQCSRFLQQEAEAMEERIKAFQEAEQTKFEALKQKMKTDKQTVMKLITQKAFDLRVSCEEENDSAVPLSPLSVTSGDMSPGNFSYGCSNGLKHQVEPNFSLPHNEEEIDDSMAFRRPKAHSNPTSLTAWKRRRHQAGPPRPRAVSEQWEEEETVFSFDEQVDVSNWICQQKEIQESSETDVGEEVFTDEPQLSGDKSSLFATSMPVSVSSGRRTGGSETRFMDESISEEDDEVKIETGGRRRQSTICEKSEGNQLVPVCAESFEVLAKSLRQPDDPDLLFGGKPNRRRYQTSGDATKARDLRMVAE